MQVLPTPQFVRMFDDLEQDVQRVATNCIELFTDTSSHRKLRVHKLHGKHKNCYAFSVTHRIRIVFQYATHTKRIVYLLAIGDHDVYQ